MANRLSSAFIIAALLLGLALVNTVNIGAAQTSTSVKGILTSDTTWTKAGSPYNLTGPLAVAKDVTLRIEPGVTVNLDSYYILVNGTLQARGTSTEKIVFDCAIVLYNNKRIEFSDVSTSWNPQTGTGCIIENAVLNSISITIGNVSPKISGNTFNDASWCNLISVEGGSPTISNNTMIFTGNGIHSTGGAPVISDNFIQGVSSSTGIFHNGFGSSALAAIVRNTIINNQNGINGYGGYQIIEGNIIQNNQIGIIEGGIVHNNTIANSSIAIDNPSTQANIMYNNIVDYSQNSIRLSQWDTFNVNATYNWWGTTDAALIDQSIRDFEDDFNLGKVNYNPILTAPNPAIASQIQGSGQPVTPSPTPNPTPEPQPSPSTQKTPSIALACSSSTSYSNFKVDVTGCLSADGAGIPSSSIQLSYKADNGDSWVDLATVTTDGSGQFSALWLPSVSGNYVLKASWAGNSAYSATSVTISFSVTPFGEENVFWMTSNSTVSKLSFNSENKKLCFCVEGPDGTTGYVNVHISKTLLTDSSNLKVFLDENPVTASVESQEDSWLVSLTYSHSTHDVTINLEAAAFDQVQIGQILIFALPLTAIALFFGIRRVKGRKPKVAEE